MEINEELARIYNRVKVGFEKDAKLAIAEAKTVALASSDQLANRIAEGIGKQGGEGTVACKKFGVDYRLFGPDGVVVGRPDGLKNTSQGQLEGVFGPGMPKRRAFPAQQIGDKKEKAKTLPWRVLHKESALCQSIKICSQAANSPRGQKQDEYRRGTAGCNLRSSTNHGVRRTVTGW